MTDTITAAAKAWPVIIGLIVAVAAIGCVIAAHRPAWLQRAANRIPW